MKIIRYSQLVMPQDANVWQREEAAQGAKHLMFRLHASKVGWLCARPNKTEEATGILADSSPKPLLRQTQ